MATSFTSCETIGSFSEYGKSLEVSHSKLFFKAHVVENNSNLIINSTSVLDRYMDYIYKHCSTYTFKQSELLKYRYRPKLFCYEIYGTTELWSLLLKINNWVSVSEFNAETIKIFNNDIFDVINEILEIESDNITKNNAEVNK